MSPYPSLGLFHQGRATGWVAPRSFLLAQFEAEVAEVGFELRPAICKPRLPIIMLEAADAFSPSSAGPVGNTFSPLRIPIVVLPFLPWDS